MPASRSTTSTATRSRDLAAPVARKAGWSELDVRAVPHAIRNATVFGALEAVQPGGAMVLVAPHDPLPLLAQVELLPVQQRHAISAAFGGRDGPPPELFLTALATLTLVVDAYQ